MSEDVYYVYEWFIIETDEVIYVGKGKKRRAWQLKKENKYFMKMYNSHNCNVRIVQNNLTEDEAFEKEIELIKYYRENTEDRLTNIADGGNQPPTYYGDDSPTKRYEVRKKISKSLKVAFSNEQLRKYIGKKQHEYCSSLNGRIEKSQRSKKVMSNLKTREKLRKANIETWSDKELKHKHSEIMKKCYNNDKVAELSRKQIVQLDFDGNKIGEYESLKQAEYITKIKVKNISKVLRKDNRTAGGFIWVYYEDYLSSNYEINIPACKINEGKKILQMTKDGKVVKEYIYPNTGQYRNTEVLRVCEGERKSYKNFKWKYKN